MEIGTSNKSFWQTEGSKDFYHLDNAERIILQPFIANIVNDLNPSTLLDFGCGNGYLSTLVNAHIETHLYDSNDDFINHLIVDESRNNINILKNESQIKNNYYDCVVQSSVLMCVGTKEELNHIFLVNNHALREGGSLVVVVTHPCFLQYQFGHYHTTFNHNNFKYLEEGLKYDVLMKNGNNDPIVFTDYHWSLSTIVNLIIQNDFRIKKIIEHPDMPYKNNKPNNYVVPWMFIIARKKEC